MSLFYFSFALSSTRPCKQKPHACLDEFRASVRFNLHFYVQHRELKGRTRDVPRLRGEKFEFPFFLLNELESPPLTRGKDRNHSTFCRLLGITPACAGKSLLSRQNSRSARGKVRQRRSMASGVGITPACAGKRLWSVPPSRPEGDHPRLRGEKPASTPSRRREAGSPPLTRGKVLILHKNAKRCGITPAYAGKSCR